MQLVDEHGDRSPEAASLMLPFGWERFQRLRVLPLQAR
jgi:hypothetical protein